MNKGVGFDRIERGWKNSHCCTYAANTTEHGLPSIWKLEKEINPPLVKCHNGHEHIYLITAVQILVDHTCF